MPTTLTKKQLNSLLVKERAGMRSKQKQSAFMKKTLSIYNGQKKRAAELKVPMVLTLVELRELTEEALKRATCPYNCGNKLTLSKIAGDHATAVARGGGFTKMNTVICCQSCNWQKSTMSAEQFIDLNTFIADRFPSDVVADIRRRLVIGGRWSPR